MTNSGIKKLFLSLSFTWLIIFVLIPNGAVVLVSLLHNNQQKIAALPITLSNYQQLFSSVLSQVLLRSFIVASLTTIYCLLIAYPFAYILARSQSYYKQLLLLFVIIPFWTSSLIRSYAIIALLKYHGIINSLLLYLHVIHQPLHLLYSNTAVYIGLIYALLPFMILALYSNMENIDQNQIDAARDLGANPVRCFTQIILPMTLPGILSGTVLVFLPAMTLFYIPNLLGGAKSLLLGNLIENYFLLINNWPMGAASSVLLLAIILIGLSYKHLRQVNVNKHGVV